MGLPGVKGDGGEKAEPGAKGEPGEKGEKGARGSSTPYGKTFPVCCNKKAQEQNIIFLTLSHMASEVLFMIWQGGQLGIHVRTKLAKVKTILGADYALAMLCSIMYAPCCQMLICNN